MKHLLLTTIAAVLLVGCGESKQSATVEPVEPVAKVPGGAPGDIMFLSTKLRLTGGRMAIRFQAHPGNTYSLHTCDDLASGKWIKLEANEFVTKMKAVEFVVSPDDGEGQRFYRVSRTSSSRSGSVSSLGGTRTTRAVSTRARRTYPAPPPMEGGDPVVQASEMMQQKDLAESNGVAMPPLPFQHAPPPTAKAPDISIHEAAWDGNIETVKQHLNVGTDVNEKNRIGLTPLHCAALWGHKETAELLINKGTDVNAKDDDGSTPLHHATRQGHKAIIELLVAKSEDVNAKDKSGKTPLDYAIGHTVTTDLLRKHGGKTGKELKAEGK